MNQLNFGIGQGQYPITLLERVRSNAVLRPINLDQAPAEEGRIGQIQASGGRD